LGEITTSFAPVLILPNPVEEEVLPVKFLHFAAREPSEEYEIVIFIYIIAHLRKRAI